MAVTNLGVVYLGLLGSYAGLILKYSTFSFGVPGKNVGTDTLMMVAIGVVASDVGALFLGSAAGRTPLRAWISPNKTVEGFIGGMVASILIALIGAPIAGASIAQLPAVALVVVVTVGFSVVGDLYESLLKRHVGAKDSGDLIPGHGGILDRIDSVLAALPVFALGKGLFGF